jgi:hypothetical protein
MDRKEYRYIFIILSILTSQSILHFNYLINSNFLKIFKFIILIIIKNQKIFKMKKLLFAFSFFALLFMSGNIYAQATMVFSTGVEDACTPTNAGTSFAIAGDSIKIYAIVNLPSAVTEATSVTYQIYKNGEQDLTSTIDLPVKTNCFWEDLVFSKPAEWTIKVLDASGNLISEGTVNITQ